MTKKAEKAARIEANRRTAYFKKVTTLVGYVGPRVTNAMIDAALAADKTAEAYAFELASLEPVGKAIFPVKAEAVKSANGYAIEQVASMTAQLEAAAWNLDVVAPRPTGTDSRNAYKLKSMIRQNYYSITRRVGSSTYAINASTIVAIDQESVARFIADAEREAADQYDAFACKLVAKVGPVDSAELDGSHVWSHSILTVRKGAKVERWKTQQIWNVSVLGKSFPQWPTRLLKEGGK